MLVFKAVIALALCLTLAKSIVVYERSGLADPYPSLKLKKSSILKATNFTLGLSICACWKFKRNDKNVAIFQNPGQNLGFTVSGQYERYLVIFGNQKQLYFHDIDEDHTKESFFINQWHHVCLSFIRKVHHLVAIQVLNSR